MKITIETEKDRCGDEFLDNGELTISPVDGYKTLVKLESDGFQVYVDLWELSRAVDALQVGKL
jgi:hypothetical protein